MCPDSTISPGFLRLQPLLPCFLRKYQSTAEQREVLQAVEKVFCEYYQQVGLQLNQLLTSQDMVAKQSGLSYVSMEFENLVTGLNLALLAQTSIAGYADVLLQFLITMHDLPRGLALCQHILVHFDQLSVDTIGDPLGFELANTLGFMSHWLFELKQYAMVEALCQGILQLIPQLAQLDEKRGNMLSAHAYLQLGMLKDEQRDFLVASHYYEQAMQIYKKFNDLHGQATLYHNMGVMAQAQQQYPQAKEWYLQAIQLKEDPVSKAETDYQLGQLALEQRQFSEAEYYFWRALEGFLPHTLHYACVYHHLGMVAQEQQQLSKAEQYYQHALKGFIAYNDPLKQAGTYIHLGQVMQEQLHYQEAREYFLLALKIFRFYGDMKSEAIALNNLARFWKVSGDMTLPAAVAPLIGFSGQETEELFRRVNEHKMIQEGSSKNAPERW